MEPIRTTVDSRYGAPGALPTPWDEVARNLADTKFYALTSLMPDGASHTAPLPGLFDDHGTEPTPMVILWWIGRKTRGIGHNETPTT